MAHRILIADDDNSSRQALKMLLAGAGYEVREASDGQEALETALAFLPTVVVSDLLMPRLDGLGLLKALQSELPFTTVIILTGHGTIETAVAALKDGAYDYLTKPVDVPRLRILIEKALEKGETLREVSVLRRRLKEVWGLGKLVGKSPAMQEIYRLIDLAAPTTAPVLITGESGTGKELVARCLHELSPRNRGPFVAVNCSAIPETLLESEIFGHDKGAFTGALERRAGCFELAHEGTLFLDEIAEMAAATQAKFLRILQDGTVRRLGGKVEMQVDVRVLAATNRDPLKALKEGAFREDLYYRLNVFTLPLPSLRGRREDIPLLIQAFLEEFNAKYEKRIRSVDEPVLQSLLAHPWPGNVRELRNTLERAVIICEDELISSKHLPPDLTHAAGEERSDVVTFPLGVTVEDAEKTLILKTLASVNNNKARAASILGISVKTLHNKLHRYGV
ncbi:MAG TPA: sigma-54 dependent transcriptional regulator [Candidatus Methylomirabilis sp.]|nr:sigma-54 dependent transcriptional regulator [Candidatus Methylomirabilis sp.]HSB82031.1 sigma-54 dependent transcriptional regulator [Candidatus Methylomirabilis sp.]HSC70916.1 sigma-54 dependent transcriptional regulator [Candidatus Methylomirabilis sp.]